MADTKQIVGYLQKVPLFQNLKSRQQERLARRFVERDYPKGKAIVSQGHGGEGFFIIISGKAEAIREKADGSKVVVNSFATGDFFGELALLDEGLRTASVVTTEDSKCLILTSWDFLAVLREDAEMAIDILQELAKRFRLALESM